MSRSNDKLYNTPSSRQLQRNTRELPINDGQLITHTKGPSYIHSNIVTEANKTLGIWRWVLTMLTKETGWGGVMGWLNWYSVRLRIRWPWCWQSGNLPATDTAVPDPLALCPGLGCSTTSQTDPPPRWHLLGASWQAWHLKLKLCSVTIPKGGLHGSCYPT